MVASHYGKRYTSETLQRICVPGPEGISLMVMRDAAEYLGFSTICLKGKTDLQDSSDMLVISFRSAFFLINN